MIRRHVCFFGIAIALLLGSATVNAQDDLLTIHDVAITKAVTSAAISPDGQHIAYTLSVPRDPKADENGGSWTQLHVVDTAGQSRPYVSGDVNVSSIGWTPDGQGISYLSRRGDDKNTSLYVIPLNGGESVKIAELENSISAYDFRSDGQQVLLLSTEPQDAAEKKLTDKGFQPEIYEEQLSPTRIWLADTDPATDDEPVILETTGSASEVYFSPDGSQILAAFAETPLIDHHYMFRRLAILNASDGSVVARIDNPGKLGEVAWSPDGKFVAFMSGEDINDPSEGRLMIVPATGGSPREIMKDYLPNISGLHWIDEMTILFSADDSCLTAIGTIRIDGTQRQFLIDPGGPILTGMSVADDGETMAFLGTTPQHPNEVFAYAATTDTTAAVDRAALIDKLTELELRKNNSPGLGEQHPTIKAINAEIDTIKARLEVKPPQSLARLTDSNPWLANKRLANQEIISYKAKNDGETIEGILIRPLDEQPGTRYPLIVAVHGGPEAHVPQGWVSRYSYPGQVAAAKGFAVFYPNYRGSTGRGVPFAKAHQADYGGKEFDDVVDGVDYLIEMGLVDGNKVGVTGGSYGGFATAWCCTRHSERFAAGVMFVGISNQISKSGTTDIPEEMFLVHARKRIWDDWQFFLERSPIYYVENCKTPLLIMHGKNDTRVHPSQSMELYRNLKILGQAPVRLVFYPGEGHGNRKAASRFDYNLRMMRWFEHYLQGAGGDPPPYQIDYGLDEEE